MELADAVLFVIDTTVGATDADEAVARVLQRSGRPVVLAANKVDDVRLEAEAAGMWSLGPGGAVPGLGAPRSRQRRPAGRGTGRLARAGAAGTGEGEDGGPRRVALLGRPNVGKSSLLNRLVGEQRSVVDEVAGTTRDPVDSLVTLGGEEWRFVDTAGLRRRVREAAGAEYYSSLRTETALRSAEVALVLLDAGERLSEQDQRILSMAVEAGRAIVIAFNKWDLVDEDRRYDLGREIDRDLSRITWAPRVNMSALTGRSVDKLATAIRTALAGLGDPRSDRRLNAGSARWSPRRRLRRAAGRSRRCSSRPRPTSGRRGSWCSARASSRRVTAVSWNGGCVRSSVSRELRSKCR